MITCTREGRFLAFFKISDFLSTHDAVGDGIDGERGDAAKMEFVADVLTVGDDGGQRDTEPVSDFLVDETTDNESKHLRLTGRKNAFRRLILMLFFCHSGRRMGRLLPVGMLEQGEDALQQIVLQL